jgi:DNA-binding transcriptional ArsR family regulator
MTDLCDKINKFGKGIGNEHRYRMLQALIKGPRTVGELVDIIKLSQPAISQHLKTLKESELVTDERRGQEVYYSLNTEHTLSLLAALVRDMERSRKEKR